MIGAIRGSSTTRGKPGSRSGKDTCVVRAYLTLLCHASVPSSRILFMDVSAFAHSFRLRVSRGVSLAVIRSYSPTLAAMVWIRM